MKNLLRRTRHGDERGDTLIEVAFALAIIASVLAGASQVAGAAMRQGVDARERSQVAQFLQEQAEALRTFRDSAPWSGSGGDTFVGNISTFCGTGFVMYMPSGGQWTPEPAGSVLYQPTFSDGSSVPTLSIKITCGQYNGSASEYLFNILATWSPPGGSGGNSNTSTVSTILGRIDDYKPQDCSATC